MQMKRLTLSHAGYLHTSKSLGLASALTFLTVGLFAQPVALVGLAPTRPPPELGPVPVPPADVSALPRGPQAKSLTGGFTVNTAFREEVRSFYNAVYRSSDGVPMGSTATVSSCMPGTNASAFQDAVLRRINWYRAMAGLFAGVTNDSTFSSKDQQAALMMSANNNLSHTPSNSWTCWSSDGTDAAANSDIALGSTGPDAITDYIKDAGSNNVSVGHRRWLLYPQTKVMGTGDIPAQGTNNSANATWIFDGNYGGPRPPTAPSFVSWPPPGYVPYQVVFPRWSFSYPHANFTNGANSTTVTMQSNGVPMAVRLETYGNSAGENTLVWVPAGLDATNYSVKFPFSGADTVYTVTISNVFTNGYCSSFTYTNTIFDPAAPGPDSHPLTMTGTGQPAVGYGNLYTCAAVTNATAYQWRQTRRWPFNWMDGAENGLTNFTANTSPGYQVVQSDIKASGSYAFRFAHPQANDQTPPTDQTLTLSRLLLPATNSVLQFKSWLGWANTNQLAKVQASVDNGLTWRDLDSQAGLGANNPGDPIFTTHTVSLAQLAGQDVHLRFAYVYVPTNELFSQVDAKVGWYLDDLVVTNAEELAGPVTNTTSSASFAFDPAQIGSWALEVRPLLYGEFPLDWGPVTSVTAVPLLSQSLPHLVSNKVQIDFNVKSGSFSTFQLVTNSQAIGPWTNVDKGAVLETIVPNSSFRFTTARSETTRFYRILAR